MSLQFSKIRQSVHSPPPVAKHSLGRIDTFKTSTTNAIDGIDNHTVAIGIRNSAKYGQEAKAADQNEAMEQHLVVSCVALQVNQSQRGQ